MQSFIATVAFAVVAISGASAAPAVMPASTLASSVAPVCEGDSTWDASINWCQPNTCPDGDDVVVPNPQISDAKWCKCAHPMQYWDNYTNQCKGRLDPNNNQRTSFCLDTVNYTFNPATHMCELSKVAKRATTTTSTTSSLSLTEKPVCEGDSTWDASINWCQPNTCPDGDDVVVPNPNISDAKWCKCVLTPMQYWDNYTNQCKGRLDPNNNQRTSFCLDTVNYTFNPATHMCELK